MIQKNPHAADYHADGQICGINKTGDRTQSRIEYASSGTCTTVQSVLFHKIPGPQQYVHGIRNTGARQHGEYSTCIPFDVHQPMFGALPGMSWLHTVRSAISIVNARRLDLEPKAGLQRSRPTRSLSLVGEWHNPQVIGNRLQYINGHDDARPTPQANPEPYRQARVFRSAPAHVSHPALHWSVQPTDIAARRSHRRVPWWRHGMRRDVQVI